MIRGTDALTKKLGGKRHYVIHFAFNPVSYKTFKKWHMSHAEFERWKEDILQVVNDSLRKNEYKVLNL